MSNADGTVRGRFGGIIGASLLALGSACSSEVAVERSSGEAGSGGGPPDTSAATSPSSTDGASTTATTSTGGGPTRATWKEAAETTLSCEHHTATEIGPGRVLIVGACALDDDEVAAVVYDLSTKTFTEVTPIVPRAGHAAIGLADGRVAFAGGAAPSAASVEVFDPATGSFTLVGPLGVQRAEPMLVAEPNGALWVVGGVDAAGHAIASTELVDLASGASFVGPSMARGRYRGAALPISGGGVWVVGGASTDADGDTEALDTTEWSGCGGCAFDDAGSIPDLSGAVAGIGIGGALCDGTTDTGTVVFGTYALAWRGGGGFDAALDLPHELFMPAAARTPTGRFIAAGGAIYANETRVLEARRDAGAEFVAARPGGGAWTTITPLGGDELLVVSGDAALLELASSTNSARSDQGATDPHFSHSLFCATGMSKRDQLPSFLLKDR